MTEKKSTKDLFTQFEALMDQSETRMIDTIDSFQDVFGKEEMTQEEMNATAALVEQVAAHMGKITDLISDFGERFRSGNL